jgi:uncharacterized protein (UPF0548 family)
MLFLRQPQPDAIRAFLAVQAGLDYSYSAVGATAGQPPQEYILDHTRALLGTGGELFEAAEKALRRWDQFRLDWLQVWPAEVPLEPGAIVAIVARAAGMWWLNACRIVYVVNESGPPQRFGFAYGTLPSHAGTGEERFLVEWDHRTNEVWYDILAFSRPRHILTRLGYPLVRSTQRRFGRESAAAMQRAVRTPLRANGMQAG